MNTALVLLVIVAVLVGGSLLLRRGPRARKSALRAIAAELGLSIVERSALGSGGARPDGDRTSPDLDVGLTTAWGTTPEAQGSWKGQAVCLGGLPTRRYRVPVGARVAVPAAWQLFACRRDAPFKLRPERLTSLTTDDATFDAAIEVAARDVEAALSMLARPGVRDALRIALSLDMTSCLSGGWLYVQPSDDDIADAAAARLWLDKVTGGAQALDRTLSQ